MGKRAFIFPGQGSQYVGMAKDIYENSAEAREMIKTADDILGFNLSHIMFNGPEDELKQTRVTQPAIFTHSAVLFALIRTLDAQGFAGHSLGEFSALYASGALQYYEALALVKVRAEAMQKAGEINKGTLAAIVGLSDEEVLKITEEAASAGIVQCANFNSPGQIVISGSIDGVRKAMELAKAKGAKLVKELVVSGAFHSPLMEPAKELLLQQLNKTNFYSPKAPVYANVDAKPNTDKERIKDLLYAQLTAPVRWEETIKNMVADGFDEFVEIGPGKVLQGLVKRIAPEVNVYGIEKYSDVEKYL